MKSILEIIETYGAEFRAQGFGRRQILTWLRKHVDHRYTEHQARQIAKAVRTGVYEPDVEAETESDPTPPPPPQPMIPGEDVEDTLRRAYGLTPDWVPIRIWGEPGRIQATWTRMNNAVDHERVEGILQTLSTHAKKLTPTLISEEKTLGVISIRDAHFGLMTHSPAPYKNYDLNEAQEAYTAASEYLMRRALGVGVTHIALVVGSDMMHVDGPLNTTTKGTPQVTNATWDAMFNAALQSIQRALSTALGSFKEVTVIVEPGNHDNTLSIAVGIALKNLWGDRVNVLAGPETLKRISVGRTHVFTHHGDNLKPQFYHGVILRDHPDAVRRGNYIEVLSGHIHHRVKTSLNTAGDYAEEFGIVHRVTPALCPASDWSESQGYRSEPGAQLTLYDSDGLVALFEWTPARMGVNDE
jgi:hypothetical protein